MHLCQQIQSKFKSQYKKELHKHIFKLNWFEALFDCQKKGMCLADIDTGVTLLALTAEFDRDDRQEIWFGLTAFERNNFRYISNNKPLEYIAENSVLINNGSCAFLKPEDPMYTFASDDCSARKHFACAQSDMCNGAHMKKQKQSCAVPDYANEIMAF